MKKLFFVLFIFLIIKMYGQTQYNCYHVQEFTWNQKTEKHDQAIEKTDLSIFKIDSKNNTLVQLFEEGTFLNYKTFHTAVNKEGNTFTYKIISPVNGNVYVYNVNSVNRTIEVSLAEGETEALLKRYLYK